MMSNETYWKIRRALMGIGYFDSYSHEQLTDMIYHKPTELLEIVKKCQASCAEAIAELSK